MQLLRAAATVWSILIFTPAALANNTGDYVIPKANNHFGSTGGMHSATRPMLDGKVDNRLVWGCGLNINAKNDDGVSISANVRIEQPETPYIELTFFAPDLPDSVRKKPTPSEVRTVGDYLRFLSKHGPHVTFGDITIGTMKASTMFTYAAAQTKNWHDNYTLTLEAPNPVQLNLLQELMSIKPMTISFQRDDKEGLFVFHISEKEIDPVHTQAIAECMKEFRSRMH